MTQHVCVGSRALTFETWGSTEGAPVFLLHGTPGSRFGPRPRGLELDLMGVRLITFDRPGYGGSDRLPGRRIADAADDVMAIADALHIEHFAVVGRSGGAPHALACAGRLPQRVTAAASLVGLAPRDAPGLDWLAGMGTGNRQAHQIAQDGVRAGSHGDLIDQISRNTGALNEPSTFLRRDHDSDMPIVDRRVLDDAGIRQRLAENFRRAKSTKNLTLADWSQGVDPDDQVLVGWLDDMVAFSVEWGFDVADIEAPVLLWHGEQDVFSPAEHSRWLAARIPKAELTVDAGSAHFGALSVLPSVLEWVLRFS
jgi:pimeloyl-ACP methyl ester carboxylesterase